MEDGRACCQNNTAQQQHTHTAINSNLFSFFLFAFAKMNVYVSARLSLAWLGHLLWRATDDRTRRMCKRERNGQEDGHIMPCDCCILFAHLFTSNPVTGKVQLGTHQQCNSDNGSKWKIACIWWASWFVFNLFTPCKLEKCISSVVVDGANK